MNVDTFRVRLTALPFLSKSEIESYQQRVQQGRVDPQTLYREALALHQGRRSEEIEKKRRDLERRLANVNLNYDDLYQLLDTVNDKSNLDELYERGQKIAAYRKKQDVGTRRARLTKSLEVSRSIKLIRMLFSKSLTMERIPYEPSSKMQRSSKRRRLPNASRNKGNYSVNLSRTLVSVR